MHASGECIAHSLDKVTCITHSCMLLSTAACYPHEGGCNWCSLTLGSHSGSIS